MLICETSLFSAVCISLDSFYIQIYLQIQSSGQADKWDKLGLGLGHGEGSESRKVGADCDVTCSAFASGSEL